MEPTDPQTQLRQPITIQQQSHPSAQQPQTHPQQQHQPHPHVPPSQPQAPLQPGGYVSSSHPIQFAYGAQLNYPPRFQPNMYAPPPYYAPPYMSYQSHPSNFSAVPTQISATVASVASSTPTGRPLPVSGTSSAQFKTRERRPAKISKPDGTEINLEEEVSKTKPKTDAATKTATTTTAATLSTTNTTSLATNTTKPTTTSATKDTDTASTTSGVTNILLQKVSEEDTAHISKPEDSKKDNEKVKEAEKIKEEEINESVLEKSDETDGDKENIEAEVEISKQKESDQADDKKDEESSESETSLHYEPGQYNPYSNRTGSKVYSKEFMVEVCEKICKFKPLGELDDSAARNSSPYSFDEQVDPFAPNFGNRAFPHAGRSNDISRRQNQQNYAGRNSAGQERPRKIITSSSLQQEVELKTVANPWKPTKEIQDIKKADDVNETELLKKKFRSILNKLTPNNFESLSEAVTKLEIDSEDKLGHVIDIVFSKALAEPGYCVLYGQMCSHLRKNSGGVPFSNTLLKRCQIQFQSDVYQSLDLPGRKKKIEEEQDPEIKKHLQEELYEEMYRCRMRGLGLIKFIGELYKIEMLNQAIMFECINRLLYDVTDESLECLCDLLITIGERLDTESKQEDKKKGKKPYQGPKSAADAVSGGSKAAQEPEMITTLDPVFERLHRIRESNDSPVSLRIKFKILDVSELREKHNWKLKNTKDNNPKKIEEIREAHREKLESERRQNAIGPRRSQEARRGLGHSGGSSNQLSSSGNETGGIRSASSMHPSSSSNSIRDHSTGDNMRLNFQDAEANHRANIKLLLQQTQNKSETNETPSLRPSSYIRNVSKDVNQLRPKSGHGSLIAKTPASATAVANNTNTATGKVNNNAGTNNA